MTEQEQTEHVANRYLSDSDRYIADSEAARYNTILYRVAYPLLFIKAAILALILWRVWVGHAQLSARHAHDGPARAGRGPQGHGHGARGCPWRATGERPWKCSRRPR